MYLITDQCMLTNVPCLCLFSVLGAKEISKPSACFYRTTSDIICFISASFGSEIAPKGPGMSSGGKRLIRKPRTWATSFATFPRVRISCVISNLFLIGRTTGRCPGRRDSSSTSLICVSSHE